MGVTVRWVEGGGVGGNSIHEWPVIFTIARSTVTTMSKIQVVSYDKGH